MAEFVATAFPNYVFECLVTSRHLSKLLVAAIDRVADSVMVKGALQLPVKMSPDKPLHLARKCRQITVGFYICGEGIETSNAKKQIVCVKHFIHLSSLHASIMV